MLNDDVITVIFKKIINWTAINVVWRYFCYVSLLCIREQNVLTKTNFGLHNIDPVHKISLIIKPCYF